MLIREKMTRDVISVNISDTLAKAEKLMRMNKINHLPVISGKKLSGMLSSTDIGRFKQNKTEAELINATIKDVMPPQQRMLTIAPDVSIEQAVLLLHNNK
ncbi:MAG: CBS domain-containing protein, partial [Clostridiales bacterium]|nr:CBS domain-containing protein [Clostridiales bacterium]